MASEKTSTEVPVGFINWVEVLKGGPIYVYREPPATPGDKGGVGPDVPKEYLGPRA
jgi:hypothetical protein